MNGMDIHNRSVSIGDNIHGFKVQKIVNLSRVRSFFYELVHEEIGAGHIHISSDDPVNVFTVMLKTLPDDSSGIPHILEHLIFCGSRKYPVRDPFHPMLQRSANVFMNGYTESDNTKYLFATPDRTDFYNLMDLFLDWIFYPLLRKTDFKRHSGYMGLNAAKDRQVYKGIVYSEVQGRMTSPQKLFKLGILKGIYPDSPYRHNAGGEPDRIPDVTLGQIRKFHKKFYHPENAFFYTYGNLPLIPHLAFLEKKIFKYFRRSGTEPLHVISQPRWKASRHLGLSLPAGMLNDGHVPHQACTAWLTGSGGSASDVHMNKLLSQIFMGNMSAPLKRTLMGSGLGYAMCDGAGVDCSKKDILFVCGMKAKQAISSAELFSLVYDTFETIALKGFDVNQVEPAVNQATFQYREVTHSPYPFGIKRFLSFAGLWLHGGNVAGYLDIATSITKIRQLVETGRMSEYIRDCFVNNSHCLTVSLDPLQNQGINLPERKKANPAADHLSSEMLIQLQKEDAFIKKYTERPDDISCLPSLDLSGISSLKKMENTTSPQIEEGLFFSHRRTNGILYFLSAFGAAELEKKLVPLLPLFCYALFKTGTETRHFSEIERISAAFTGGLSCTAQVLPVFGSKDTFLSQILIKAKCFDSDRDKMFRIIEDVLVRFRCSDLGRLKQLVLQYEAALENALLKNGHKAAEILACRNINSFFHLKERLKGVHQLIFIKNMSHSLTKKRLVSLSDDLLSIKSGLIGSNNVKNALVGSRDCFSDTRKTLEKIRAQLPHIHAGTNAKVKAINGCPVNEGWNISRSVSFVAEAVKAVSCEHRDAAALSVMSRIIWFFVNREVREKQGAYSGSARYNHETGVFSFHSQNAPDIAGVLDVFKAAVSFVKAGGFESKDIEKGVFMEMVKQAAPESPGAAGINAFYRHLVSLPEDIHQRFSEQLEGVTGKDVRAVAERYFSQCQDTDRGTVVLSDAKTLLRISNIKDQFALRSI